MNYVLSSLILSFIHLLDAKDMEQLKTNNITHIVAIHDNAKAWIEVKQKYSI